MSKLEEEMVQQFADYKLKTPEREHRFHPVRRWRFDFAWPEKLLAVEVEGGIWTRGRHVSPQGFIKDCEKYNHAAARGWKVLRFGPNEVKSKEAIKFIKRVYNDEKDI